MTSATERPLALLGPQRQRPSVDRIVDRLAPRGPVATVTAGWQEREGEDAELDQHLGGRSVNLGLYRRAQDVWTDDPELADAHKALGERLRTLRRAYVVQLTAHMDALAALRELKGEADVLEVEREAATRAVRDLDARHLARVQELRDAFEDALRPGERDAVARHRSEIARQLEGVSLVVVTGGHVAVLLNRLRLFGLADLLGSRGVVAWSAGAMAMAGRVVLFHDSPPWGGGHAEVFDVGLGLFRDLVPFPHGATRLALDDGVRVARLAARLWPARCVLLEPGTQLEREGPHWRTSGPARRLTRSGRVEEMTR